MTSSRALRIGCTLAVLVGANGQPRWVHVDDPATER